MKHIYTIRTYRDPVKVRLLCTKAYALESEFPSVTSPSLADCPKCLEVAIMRMEANLVIAKANLEKGKALYDVPETSQDALPS